VPQIRGDKLIDRRGSDWNGNAEDTESIRTTMSSMDLYLKILIELFSEQMDKMMSAVADVRTAVITSNPDPSSSLSDSARSSRFVDQRSLIVCRQRQIGPTLSENGTAFGRVREDGSSLERFDRS
jgi:hypothetical protein